MITSVEFKKKIRKATTDNVSAIKVFLETDSTVSYEKIAKAIGRDESDKDFGKAVGGLLSALGRTILENEPLIIALGPDPSQPEKSKRRLLWKLNPAIISDKNHRDELLKVTTEVLAERQ